MGLVPVVDEQGHYAGLLGGVENAGLLELLAGELLLLTGGDPMITAFTTLWLSAVVSAAIDNIPFVATMIPLIQSMEIGLGGVQSMELVWWSLTLGACRSAIGQFPLKNSLVDVAKADDTRHPFVFPHHRNASDTV